STITCTPSSSRSTTFCPRSRRAPRSRSPSCWNATAPFHRCRSCSTSSIAPARRSRRGVAPANRLTPRAPPPADVERLMARLLTDRALRERFLADPAAVAREEGLSAEEAAAIAKTSSADLRTAARSYDLKRAAKRRQGRMHPLFAWLAGR